MEFSASLSGAPFFYIVVAARTFHSNFFLDSAEFFFARLTLMSPRWRLFFHAPRSHFTLFPLWWSRARSSRDFFLLFDFHRLFEFPVANDDDDEWNGGEKRHVARLLLLLFGWLLFSFFFCGVVVETHKTTTKNLTDWIDFNLRQQRSKERKEMMKRARLWLDKECFPPSPSDSTKPRRLSKQNDSRSDRINRVCKLGIYRCAVLRNVENIDFLHSTLLDRCV